MIRFQQASFALVIIVLLGLSADAQVIQNAGGTGVNSSFSGGATNCVLFNKNNLIGCDSGFIYNGSGAANPQIQVPMGTFGSSIPGIAFTTDSTSGFGFISGNTVIYQGGIAGLVMNSGSITNRSPSNFSLSWSSVSTNSTAADTGISRLSPTIIAIGNGVSGNTAGGFITGTASLVSLTTGTNADFLCLKSDGTVLIQNSACTISALRFKPDWKPYQDDAIAKLAKMDVGTFHIQTGHNADPNAASLQAGLSAESVAAIAPECAIYENDMKTPKSYRQECVIALLVKAIQQLRK